MEFKNSLTRATLFSLYSAQCLPSELKERLNCMTQWAASCFPCVTTLVTRTSSPSQFEATDCRCSLLQPNRRNLCHQYIYLTSLVLGHFSVPQRKRLKMQYQALGRFPNQAEGNSRTLKQKF